MWITDQHFGYINQTGVDIQQVLCTFAKILWNHFFYTAWLNPTVAGFPFAAVPLHSLVVVGLLLIYLAVCTRFTCKKGWTTVHDC